ncbi:MAG: hypothetical protein IPH04_19105 [Saprospirales bacterium]|nr:hypothetical protein [Saprospirales bacterium]
MKDRGRVHHDYLAVCPAPGTRAAIGFSTSAAAGSESILSNFVCGYAIVVAAIAAITCASSSGAAVGCASILAITTCNEWGSRSSPSTAAIIIISISSVPPAISAFPCCLL